MGEQQFSRAIEDILKAIYKLSETQDDEKQGVSTTLLAERLGVSKANVSMTLKKLAERGLVEHAPYYGAHLTEAGRRVAVGLIRKHRILELYLVKKLDYGWDEVDAEAEVLEHTISDKLTHQMWLALGKPTHDPHGSPIPSADFEVPDEPWFPLSEAEEGAQVEIQRIRNGSPEALRYLQSLGLMTGQVVKVISKAPLKGPITLQVDGKAQVVDTRLAETIGVKPHAT